MSLLPKHAVHRGLLALLVVMLSLSGAGGAIAAQTPPGVLVVGQVAEPKSLDPAAVTSLNDFRILVNLYEGLVGYEQGSLELAPALAESWEIANDGKLYTFHLRRGVTFHDGTPFDADAVKFNLERMLDPDHPYHDTGPFPLAFFYERIQRVEVVDDYTVRLHLDRAYAPLLSNLAYPTGAMVSPAAVGKHGKEFGRHPVGTGPFRFAQWQANRRVVIEANPDYRRGPPALKAVVFRPIGDPLTRVAELMAGGVDLAVELPPDNVTQLRRESGFTVHEAVGPHLWFLILNTREPPFSLERMRQAVNYAIDKRALVEQVLQGSASVAAGPVPAAFDWAYNDEIDPYPYDPDKARALIEEAGYGDGVKVRFYVTQSGSGMLAPVQMATAIQADLAKVGIEAEIESYEWNTYLGKVNDGLAGKADMAEMAWMTNDPDTLLSLALHSDATPDKGGFNSGYYRNPEVDRLIEVARTTSDRVERAVYYRSLQRILRLHAPWAFIASWKQNAVTAAGIDGFELQPSFFLDLYRTRKP